jgi:hypothetical protein
MGLFARAASGADDTAGRLHNAYRAAMRIFATEVWKRNLSNMLLRMVPMRGLERLAC